MSLKKHLIVFYEWLYVLMRRWKFNIRFRFSVLSPEKTVERIRKTNCSIARFGDGEFGLITGSRKPSFQEADVELAQRLREVCACKDPRLMVCIPHSFKTTKDCNDFAKKFWDWWLWDNDNLKKAAECLGLSPWRTRVFGDAQITRPYRDWKDKSKAGDRFRQLASLWNQRDIVIVEGAQTRLGVGNDLLNNAKSVRRIICPAKNAFNRYTAILQAAQSVEKETLFLIALGPTATVLAYDLAISGYQALDIGHIDIEYEWFLQGATSKVAVPGKYTQEAHESVAEEKTDHLYQSQIVMRIE